jgi:hypothetical protein
MPQLREVKPGTIVTIPAFHDGKTYTVQPTDPNRFTPDIDIVAEDGVVLTAPCQLQVKPVEA